MPVFSHVVEAPELESRYLHFHSFAEVLFEDRDPSDGDAVVLVGCAGRHEVTLTLADLRCLTVELWHEFTRLGLEPGQTVALVRFPRTSELLLAVVYVALSAWGCRVFFPNHLDRELGDWLRTCGPTALFANYEELASPLARPEDRLWGPVASEAAIGANARPLCLERDLDLTRRVLARQAASGGGASRNRSPQRPALPSATGERTPCAVLTTSGTSGHGRLVAYEQGAFLRSCAAWEQSGLLSPERLGGRAFCPLLAHSMGLRALWNALWSRHALVFISPEWFFERPSRIPGLLLRMRPEHATGGPAVFTALLEFARYFPALTPLLFHDMRCLVSSGSPYDRAIAARVEQVFGSMMHNAFGTTETQQITNTILGGGDPRSGAIGAPLPGVALGLAVREGLAEGTFVLYARSPFACSGYLGESTPTEGEFWPTGDVVRRDAEGLRFAGREREDFFKDAFGVKIPRLRLQEIYGGLAGAEWLEFAPLREEPGLAALVFAPSARPRQAARLRREIEEALGERLARLRSDTEDFERRHLSVQRFALVPARPPRTRKGNVSRAEVLAQWGTVLDGLTAARPPSGGGLERAVKVQPARPLAEHAADAAELARVFAVRALLRAGWRGGALG